MICGQGIPGAQTRQRRDALERPSCYLSMSMAFGPGLWRKQHVSGFEERWRARWTIGLAVGRGGPQLRPLPQRDLLWFPPPSSLPVPPDRHPCSARGSTSPTRVDKANAIINAHPDVRSSASRGGSLPLHDGANPTPWEDVRWGAQDPALARPHGLWQEAECDPGTALLGSPDHGAPGRGWARHRAVRGGAPGEIPRALVMTNLAVFPCCRTATGCARPRAAASCWWSPGDGHRHGSPRPPAVACRRLGRATVPVTNLSAPSQPPARLLPCREARLTGGPWTWLARRLGLW